MAESSFASSIISSGEKLVAGFFSILANKIKEGILSLKSLFKYFFSNLFSVVRKSIDVYEFFTSVGPFNFSFSQPLSKASTEKTEKFRFNLGTTF